jgi:hypothetical protein
MPVGAGEVSITGDENNRPATRRGSVKDIAKMFGGKSKTETAESFHNKKVETRAKDRAMSEQATTALHSVRTGGVSVFEENQATQRDSRKSVIKKSAAQRNTNLAAAKQTAEEVTALEEVQVRQLNKALFEEKVVSTISERVESSGYVCSVIPMQMEYSPERPSNREAAGRYEVDEETRGKVADDVDRIEDDMQGEEDSGTPQPGGEQCKAPEEPLKADFTSPIYSTPSKPPLHKRSNTEPRRLSGDLVTPNLSFSSPDSDDDFISTQLTNPTTDTNEDDLPLSPTRTRSGTWGGSEEGSSPRVRSFSCSGGGSGGGGSGSLVNDETGDSIIFDDSFDSDSDVEEEQASAESSPTSTATATDTEALASTPTTSTSDSSGSSSGGKSAAEQQRQRVQRHNRPIGARTHRHSLSPTRLAEAGRARSVSSPPLPMGNAATGDSGGGSDGADGQAWPSMGMGRLLGWAKSRGKGTSGNSAVRGDGNIAKARLLSTDLKEFAAQIITQDRFLGLQSSSSATGNTKFGSKTKRMMPPVLVERCSASLTVEWVGAPLCKRFELQYAKTSGKLSPLFSLSLFIPSPSLTPPFFKQVCLSAR